VVVNLDHRNLKFYPKQKNNDLKKIPYIYYKKHKEGNNISPPTATFTRDIRKNAWNLLPSTLNQ
jgi:hypothetical protein